MDKLFLSIGVFVVYLGKLVEGNIVCDNDWVPHDNGCYLFNTTRVTWFRAQKFCQDKGGWLVHEDTINKRNFLRTTIMQHHKDSDPQTVGYWTAGNDLEIEGRYVWGYPQGTPLVYTDWFSGEPNNHWTDGRPEDCVVIWGHAGYNYQWNDQPCDTLDYFICEKGEFDAASLGNQ